MYKRLSAKKSKKRVVKLRKMGYKTKTIKLPNGDIAVMKKKVKR